jgi:hypothetical protein
LLLSSEGRKKIERWSFGCLVKEWVLREIIAESINVTFMKICEKRLLMQHAAFIYVYILDQNDVKGKE